MIRIFVSIIILLILVALELSVIPRFSFEFIGPQLLLLWTFTKIEPNQSLSYILWPIASGMLLEPFTNAPYGFITLSYTVVWLIVWIIVSKLLHKTSLVNYLAIGVSGVILFYLLQSALTLHFSLSYFIGEIIVNAGVIIIYWLVKHHVQKESIYFN